MNETCPWMRRVHNERKWEKQLLQSRPPPTTKVRLNNSYPPTKLKLPPALNETHVVPTRRLTPARHLRGVNPCKHTATQYSELLTVRSVVLPSGDRFKASAEIVIASGTGRPVDNDVRAIVPSSTHRLPSHAFEPSDVRRNVDTCVPPRRARPGVSRDVLGAPVRNERRPQTVAEVKRRSARASSQ